MSRTLVFRPRSRRQKTWDVLREKGARDRKVRRTQRHVMRLMLGFMARGFGE